MKYFLIVIAIAAAIFIIAKVSIPKPDQNIPEATNQTNNEVNNPSTSQSNTTAPNNTGAPIPVPASNIAIAFTGYGPGKQHDGTITVKESRLIRFGNTFSGEVDIDMNSISSSPDMLVKDLKSTRFFDVAKYPTATFVITKEGSTEVKGNLTLKGVTKPVTLPITYDAATKTYNSTVRINMELFGINQALADKEFVLRISVK